MTQIIFIDSRMTAEKPQCRSEELLFCLWNTDQVSSANMLFWKAANPSGVAVQACGILLQEGLWLLYVSLQLFLTSGHLTWARIAAAARCGAPSDAFPMWLQDSTATQRWINLLCSRTDKGHVERACLYLWPLGTEVAIIKQRERWLQQHR